MSTLAQLRKTSSLDNLTKSLQQTNKQKNDERYWQPTVDKAGNGFSIIRFLERPYPDFVKYGEDEVVSFVSLYTHGFEGPGGWYIENSLTTLDQPDPVSEYNSKLWKSGNEANKKIATAQKRRLSYISNILVVKDPAHPENEGMVFLFKYGKKIYEKIRRAIKPTEEEITLAAQEGIDLKGVDVFNLDNGHDFKLKVRKVEGYRNYDTSEFVGMATAETPAKGTPIAATYEEIERIWKSTYSLKDLVAPDQFKSYDVLKAKLDKVLGLDGGQPASKDTVKSKPVDATVWSGGKDEVESDDEKMLSMFKELAEEQ